MNLFGRYFSLLIISTLSFVAIASIDAYPFDDSAKESQFRELINELRCPKCQNQTISDSDAGLSKDIKDKTYAMVQEGATKEEVIDFMVQRYGDFIHYQPPVKQSTWILWFGPFIFLFVAFFGVLFMIRQKQTKHPLSTELSDSEKTRLQELMKKDEQS